MFLFQDDENQSESAAPRDVEYDDENDEESDPDDFIVDDDGKPIKKKTRRKPIFTDA